MTIDQTHKAAIRKRVWQTLEASGASPQGAHGRIPNFVGSDIAADLVISLTEWQQARTMKANPDKPQQPVRAHALRAGKLLFMAVPKLAEVKPFYRLDPEELGAHPERAADRRVAARLAPKVAVGELPPIDFIICGSVAVNHEGVRIGKGAGYSDIEVALLAEAGLLKPETTIVTTVHELQVIDEELPSQAHDFTVDYVVTQERVISCSGASHRPSGIDWSPVTPDMAAKIPVLAALRSQPGNALSDP